MYSINVGKAPTEQIGLCAELGTQTLGLLGYVAIAFCNASKCFYELTFASTRDSFVVPVPSDYSAGSCEL